MAFGRCPEMLHKVKTARHLRPRERVLVIEAWFTLLLIRLRLRFLPYASWRPELVRAISHDPGTGADLDRNSLFKIVKLFEIAVRNQWPSASCLRRSLALHRFLTRRAVPAKVVIGIKLEKSCLAGHAWVEVANRVMSDHRDVRTQYHVFESGRLNPTLLNLLDSVI
jgi:Transglutaminase-like superfamily